jgi:hypothetical protein
MVWATRRCAESYRLVWAVTVVRPRCTGTATARTDPLLTGRKLAGGGDRGRGGPLGQPEERHQRSHGVGQGHQDPAVHDPTRGAQVRRPVQARDHQVRAGLIQDQAEVSGERHERDQSVQVSGHDAELSRGSHTFGLLAPMVMTTWRIMLALPYNSLSWENSFGFRLPTTD